MFIGVIGWKYFNFIFTQREIISYCLSKEKSYRNVITCQKDWNQITFVTMIDIVLMLMAQSH